MSTLPFDLRKALISYLSLDPLAVPDVLQIVGEATTAYVDKLKRNSQAASAITTLAGFAFGKLPKSVPPAFLLDAVWNQYPSGFTHRTVHDDKMLEVFLDGCRREPLSVDWVRMTRGDECAEWFERHVVVATR